jgi:hypothetical protein
MSKFPVSALATDFLNVTEYDIIICALGFERRASAVACCVSARRKLVFGFDHNKNYSYDRNFEFFKSAGFSIFSDLSNSEFSVQFGLRFLDELNGLLSEQQAVVCVCIDVSSFDRFRLAEIVSTLSLLTRNLRHDLTVNVDFAYSVAKFLPPRPVLGRNEYAGPVHKGFAGRFSDPGRPLALIAGLGYEMGKVMGASEYLQASRVVSFFPDSPVHRFEPEVLRANSSLLNSIRPADKINYPVADPYRAMAILDAVVHGLDDEYNIVMLPGGPKIFAVICLVLQRQYREISVWRVSSGRSINAHDVEASGYTVGFRWSLASVNRWD